MTGRTSWTSDLAEIPAKYGVKNVYGFRCAACTSSRPPNGCITVAGDTSPHGWSKFFAFPD